MAVPASHRKNPVNQSLWVHEIIVGSKSTKPVSVAQSIGTRVMPGWQQEGMPANQVEQVLWKRKCGRQLRLFSKMKMR